MWRPTLHQARDILPRLGDLRVRHVIDMGQEHVRSEAGLAFAGLASAGLASLPLQHE